MLLVPIRFRCKLQDKRLNLLVTRGGRFLGRVNLDILMFGPILKASSGFRLPANFFRGVVRGVL